MKALFVKGFVCYAKLFGFYFTGHGVALNLFKQGILMTVTVPKVSLDISWSRIG